MESSSRAWRQKGHAAINKIEVNFLLTMLALSFTAYSLLIDNNSSVMTGVGDNFTVPFKQIFSPEEFHYSTIDLPIPPKEQYSSSKFNFIFFLDNSGSTDDEALIEALQRTRDFEEYKARVEVAKLKAAIVESINSTNTHLPNSEDFKNLELKELLLLHQLYMLQEIQDQNGIVAKFKVIQFGSSEANRMLSKEKSWSPVDRKEIYGVMRALEQDSKEYNKTDVSKLLNDLDFVLKNTYNNEDGVQNIVTVISDFADTETPYTSLFHPKLKRISRYFADPMPLNLSLVKLPSKSPKRSSDVLETFSSFIPNEYMNIHHFPFSLEKETIHLVLKSYISPIYRQSDVSVDFFYSNPIIKCSSTTVRVTEGLAKKNPKILVSLHEYGNTGQQLNYRVIGSGNEESESLDDKGFIHQNYPNVIPLKNYEGLNMTYYFKNNTLPRLSLEVFLENSLYRYLVPVQFKRRLTHTQAYLIVGSEISSLLIFLLLVMKVFGKIYLKIKPGHNAAQNDSINR